MKTDIFDYENPEDLQKLAQKAVAVVREAGAFLAETSISHIEQKEGHANFVTDMDVAVQERLVTGLLPLLPDASFLLEESDEPASFNEFIWIIDPIDGTQNFISHNGQSAIAVGLIHHTASGSGAKATAQEGLLGIVYNPFLQELFLGIRGQGATLNGQSIRPSQTPLCNAVLSIGTSLYYEELRESVWNAFRTLSPLCGDFRRFGSAALELCYTACGRVDGYFEYRLCPWDYAAASIILREAGGQITTIDGSPWNYTKPVGILSGNAVLFDALKEALP